MLQKSLGYDIKKNPKILLNSRKSFHFQENQKLQNLSHELEQRLFCQRLFWPNTLTLFAKISKEMGFLPHCLVKYMACL